MEKTLVPPRGLVVPNPTAPDGPPVCCLLTKDWIAVRAFIAQALQLPITVGDFEARYGTFTDGEDVEGCVAAMKALQNLSSDFGDPNALVRELATDPTILQGATAPAQLYLHFVWFATQLYNTATTFNQTLGQFMTLLSSAPVDQRQATATETLTGDGGLQSQAASMKQLANDLSRAMVQFNLKLTQATDTVSTFSGESTKFYQDVRQDIKADKDEDDKQKKIQLQQELKWLNTQMALVNTAARNFANHLAKMEGIWLALKDDLACIVEQFAPGQFNDLPTWAKVMKLDDATQDWQTISAAASRYTENSLVSNPIQEFGATLPPNLPTPVR